MKYLLLLFILSIISCNSQSKNCSKFKTGTFEYENKNTGWVVMRTDSTQTEVNKNQNVRIVSSLEWSSDCKYTLTYIQVNGTSKDPSVGTKIEVEILSTSNNSYEYSAKNDLEEFNGKMVKVD